MWIKELREPTMSQLGDLWFLGKHKVLCGDSTNEENYTALMDGVKANLVLTDPPYNVDVEETAGKIMNDNMADQDFYNFLLSSYKAMYANLADDGSIYVWHADTEGLNFRKAFQDAGFYLSGCCIWKKNSLVLGDQPVPVDSRALPLWLEAKGYAQVVQRPEADHGLGIR
jgi:DNA modification methylase